MHIAFAIISIVLIFLSNVDTKVCFFILGVYSYLFLIRNLQSKAKASAWIVGVLVVLASLNAYKINPQSDKHLRRTIQGTKNKNWSKAGDNFSKMYTECSHCILKYQDYPESLKRESLISSYNEKSNSYRSMMNVIHKVHKNVPEDQLSYVLLQKSANELNGLGGLIRGQNERIILTQGLESTEKNNSYRGKQKRTIASNPKLIHPKQFFKNKNKSKNLNKKNKIASKKKGQRPSIVRQNSKKAPFKRVAKSLY